MDKNPDRTRDFETEFVFDRCILWIKGEGQAMAVAMTREDLIALKDTVNDALTTMSRKGL